MKRYGLLIVGLFFVSFVSAVPLTGFWGVPWGTSSPEIETIMSSKGYVVTYKSVNALYYKNVKFAGRIGDAAFFLRDSKFAYGVFVFTPGNNLAYDTYVSMKNDLTDKYGQPDKDKEEYSYPYTKNDGHTETAIMMNYVKMSSAWAFDAGDFIVLSFKVNEKNASVDIMLAYYNYEMIEAINKEKKRSTMDDL